jgi:hypothetical protein
MKCAMGFDNWLEATRALKKLDQIYVQWLAGMIKRSEGEGTKI